MCQHECTLTVSTVVVQATLMRSSKTLEMLLEAAVRFARCGEPQFHALLSDSPNVADRTDTQLLPPAMRRVTDCIRVALQSSDMAEVILRFLRQLPTLQLDIPIRFLPRSVSQTFQVLVGFALCCDHDACTQELRRCKSERTLKRVCRALQAHQAGWQMKKRCSFGPKSIRNRAGFPAPLRW